MWVSGRDENANKFKRHYKSRAPHAAPHGFAAEARKRKTRCANRHLSEIFILCIL
jgi:hypothetical protein